MTRKGLSKRTRFDVFKRDLFTCTYCGRRPPDVVLHVDHVVPVARGGTNDPDNLTTSCQSCNAGKAANGLGDAPPVVDEMARLEAIQDALERASLLVAQREAAESLELAYDEMVAAVHARWQTAWGVALNDPVYPDPTSVRRQFKRHGMQLDDVLEAVDITRWKIDSLDGYDAHRAIRYFFGVCKGIRLKGEGVA